MTTPSFPAYAAPVIGFRSRKAAQMSAFFALKSNGGLIDKLKLIKLIYLSERAFLKDNHYPMLFDELYSLPNGPICSGTLNGIDGIIHSEIWDDFVARTGNRILPIKHFTRQDFDEISDAELDVLEQTWSKFGHMSAFKIRDYTHTDCPEYTEITSGRIPISYKEVFEALGEPDAALLDEEIADLRRAESALLG
jgi:uncharacterized phage-associated protein